MNGEIQNCNMDINYKTYKIPSNGYEFHFYSYNDGIKKYLAYIADDYIEIYMDIDNPHVFIEGKYILPFNYDSKVVNWTHSMNPKIDLAEDFFPIQFRKYIQFVINNPSFT